MACGMPMVSSKALVCYCVAVEFHIRDRVHLVVTDSTMCSAGLSHNRANLVRRFCLYWSSNSWQILASLVRQMLAKAPCSRP